MDEHELRRLMYTAQLPNKGTFVIRYPRGRGVLTDWKCPLEEIEVGTGRKLHDGKDVAILSIGPIGNNVENAIKKYNETFVKDLLSNMSKKIYGHCEDPIGVIKKCKSVLCFTTFSNAGK